jgi:hypothetical protein
MELDSYQIANRFNSTIPDSLFGFSVDSVTQILGIAPSTLRKYNKLLRDVEDTLIRKGKKPFGFSVDLRSKAFDRTSFLLMFSLVHIQKFFNNEKLSIKTLYTNWEEIKCQVKL